MNKNRFKRILKTKKMFVCLLASYIAIFTFMSCFLVWMYFESDSKVKENVTEYNVTCVEHVAKIFDSFCSEMEEIARQMKYSPIIDSAISGTDIISDYSSYENLLSYMWQLKARHPFIIDAYVYLPENNMIYSHCAIVDAEIYFNQIRKYKDYDYISWKNKFLTGGKAHNYFPVEGVDEYGISQTNVVTYSNSYTKMGMPHVVAYFNVLIDIDKMLESIDEIQLLNGFDTFAVYNRDNNIVFKIGDETPDVRLLDEHLQKGEKYFDFEGKSAFYVSSNFKPWVYSISADKISFLDEMSGFTAKLKLILLFNVIIGILMIIWMTMYNYRPFKRFLADITTRKGSNTASLNHEIGEVELLKSIFFEQEKNMLEYEDVVIKQKRLIKENVLRNILLLGQANENDNAEKEKIDKNSELIDFNAEMYGTVALLLHGPQNHELKNGIQLIEYAVFNMFSDVLSEDYNINIVGIEKGLMALVVNLDKENVEGWFEDIQKWGNHINNVMISEFGVELFVGVGNVYDSQDKLAKSFNEATNALDFHNSHEENCVTFYSDLLDNYKKAKYYYYPSKADYRILSSVVLENYDQVKEILDDIYDINTKSEIDQTAKYQLNLKLVSLYQDVAVSCSVEPEFFSEESKKGSTSEIIKIIKNQYRMLCGDANMTKSNKSEKFIETVNDYIYEHYSEYSLNVSVISEQFGITRQYLSTRYRGATGEKIVDFIAKVRVEKAKELLKDRSLNISQIAERVGFINDIGLIRTFKRLEGVTPGYYRNDVQE